MVPLVGTIVTNGITTALALLYIRHRNQLEERRQRQLKMSEEQHRTALEGAAAGHFELNPKTGVLKASPLGVRMMGIEPDDWKGRVEDLMARAAPFN